MKKYQIYTKGKPVSLEPSTYYETREQAEARIVILEAEFPTLKGNLEVR